MELEKQTPSTKAVVWGLFLMILGSALLFERLGVVTMPSWETLWPVFVYVVAVTRFLDGRIGSGVANLLIATWLLACTTHWNGATFGRSWPLAIVAVGIGIVLRALTGEDSRHRRKKEE